MVKKKLYLYNDLTNKFIKIKPLNFSIVKDNKFFIDSKGNKFFVDNKNVVIDYSFKEKEMALWLSRNFGGVIFLLPKINNPKGIESSDYLWNGEKWDLKTMTENAISKTRAVDNIVKTAKNQTENIILDISNNKIDVDIIIKQVIKLYSTYGREWLDKIMIVKDYNLIKIFERKKRNCPPSKRSGKNFSLRI